MSFNTNQGKQAFSAASGQTSFTFNFKVYDDTDIKVYLTPVGQVPNDTNDILTYITDYTVSINGDDGGAISLVTGATLDDTIVINRDLPVTRDISFVTQGDLRADTLNVDQDYQTYLIMDGFVALLSVLNLPTTAIGVSNLLPPPEASKMIGWNNTGTALENTDIDTSDIDAVLALSGNIKTVAGLEDEMNTTIGLEDEMNNILSNMSAIVNVSAFLGDVFVVTMTALKALDVGTNVYANMLGYHTKGDGGGGVFYWDSTSTETANDGTIVEADGETTGRWKRVYSGAVNVRWFGARASIGVDDTLAIQTALDASLSVFIPNGLFRIGSTIKLNPHNVLSGVGGGYTSASSSSRLSTIEPFTGDSMIEVKDTFDSSGERRMELKDLILNANNYIDNVIVIEGFSSGRITNISALNGRAYGIKVLNYSLTKNSGNMTVNDCYVRMDNAKYISDSVTYPIYAAYYCEGLFNIFTNCTSDGGVIGIDSEGASLGGYNTFSKCHPEGFLNTGIKLGDTNGRNTIADCDIVATKVDGDAGVTGSIGILVDNYSYSNIINGNTIYNIVNSATYPTGSAGIKLDVTSGQVIGDNFIYNFEYGITISGSLNMISNNNATATVTAYEITSGGNNHLNNCYGGFDNVSGYLVDNAGGQDSNTCSMMSSFDGDQLYNNISTFRSKGILDNATENMITLNSSGTMTTNGGIESIGDRGTTTLDTTFSVDFDITSIRICAKVTCGINGTSGDNQAFRESFLGGYSLTLNERNVFTHEDATAGGWTFEKPDNNTLRITHTAGTSSNDATYFIKVESA